VTRRPRVRRLLGVHSAYRASAYGGCMSRESTHKKISRGYPRVLEARQFQPMIDSWDLHDG
jgi:hypothetical protein